MTDAQFKPFTFCSKYDNPSSKSIAVGELIGWRMWRLDEDDYEVRSLFQGFNNRGTIWHPKEVIQAGDAGWGFEPWRPDYLPGIHAFKTKEEVHAYSKKLAVSEWILLYGTIYMWGTVIEHELGYRAEYATIRHIETFQKYKWIADPEYRGDEGTLKQISIAPSTKDFRIYERIKEKFENRE